MPVFRNESNGTWHVMARYVDWQGNHKQKCKRGFKTKREALEWERVFHLQQSADMDMSFESFVDIYKNDIRSRIKETTWLTKVNIIDKKILPYFGKRKSARYRQKRLLLGKMICFGRRTKPESHILSAISKQYTIS